MRTSIGILFVAVALSSLSGCSSGSDGSTDLDLTPGAGGKADGTSTSRPLDLNPDHPSYVGHIACNELLSCDVDVTVDLKFESPGFQAWGAEALKATGASETALAIAQVTLTAESNSEVRSIQTLYARYYRQAEGIVMTPEDQVYLRASQANPHERFAISLDLDPALRTRRTINVTAQELSPDGGTLQIPYPFPDDITATMSAQWH